MENKRIIDLLNTRGGGRSWNDEVILFGTGQMAEDFYNSNKDKLKIKFCLDNDKTKQGKTFHGIKIYNPYDKNISIDKYKIIVASMYYSEISEQLENMGLKEFENFILYSLFRMAIGESKKLAIIYGNCHTMIIKEYLMKYKNFSDKIEFYNIPMICQFKDLGINSIRLSPLKNCDLFLYQNVQVETYGEKLSTDYLLKQLKKNCICVKLANTFNHAEGFFPQIIPNKNNKLGFFPLGDENIDKLFNQGKSVNEIICILKESNIYTKNQVMDNLDYQISRLSEKEQDCDIKIVDYIKQNYKKERLFYDPYHPTNFLLKEITRRILKYLNLYDEQFEEIEIETTLSRNQIPVYPCVAKHLGLEYKSDMGRVPSDELRGKELSFDDYIREYIKWCYGVVN